MVADYGQHSPSDRPAARVRNAQLPVQHDLLQASLPAHCASSLPTSFSSAAATPSRSALAIGGVPGSHGAGSLRSISSSRASSAATPFDKLSGQPERTAATSHGAPVIGVVPDVSLDTPLHDLLREQNDKVDPIWV